MVSDPAATDFVSIDPIFEPEAALAVAHGLPYEAAIAALCCHAVQIFSIREVLLLSDEATEIKPVQANFFICAGDPLQPKNHIYRMWIDGEECDLRTRHTELYEIYKNLD